MSLFHDEEDHKGEPIKGLPQLLPQGERILWQGSPDGTTLAIHAMHVRPIGLYFLALMGWQAATQIQAGVSVGPAIGSTLGLGVAGLIAIGILTIIARMMAKATIYTVTSERVVIRSGVALRKYINLPFAQIGAVAMKEHASGKGDLALEITKGAKLPYLHLWPHARPLKFGNPTPLLRSMPDVKNAADTLIKAMQEFAPDNVTLSADHSASTNSPQTDTSREQSPAARPVQTNIAHA